MFKITHSKTENPKFLAVCSYPALKQIRFYRVIDESWAKVYPRVFGVWKIKYKVTDSHSVMETQNQN